MLLGIKEARLLTAWNILVSSRFVRLIVLAALWIAGDAGLAAAGQVELVSRVAPSQLSDTGASEAPNRSAPISLSISNDGRYVVFISTATNLVQGQQDVNLAEDVFLRDLATGTTTLVSRSIDSPVKAGDAGSGSPVNGTADGRIPVISGDGRYIIFTSAASDLAPGQVYGNPAFSADDLLLYDRVTGTNSIVVSDSEAAALEPAVSADGRYIAFTSAAENLVPGQQQGGSNVFLYDRTGKSFRLVSHTSASAVTAGGGRAPVISADGRYVVFVRIDFTSGQSSVLLYDRVSGAVTLIGPGSRAVMSSDASQIAVITDRSLDLYDRKTGVRTQLSHAPGKPSISTDGRFTVFISNKDDVFPGQPDGTSACFLYDRISRTYTLVSRRQDSPTVARSAFAPAISGDGRFVVFVSSAKDIVSGQTDTDSFSDIFLFNRISGTTKLVSRSITSASTTANASSSDPTISANGSRVIFVSKASDLELGLADFNGAQDAFAYAISSGTNSAITRRAPEMPSFSSVQPLHQSAAWALSADGRWVAFESFSSNLVPGQEDTNRLLDVFLYDRVTKAVILVSRSNGSVSRTANGRSDSPGISADGRYVVYTSLATDIVPGTAGPYPEYRIFLFDRIAGTNRLVARTASTDRSEFPEFPTLRISPDGRWVAFTSRAPDLVPGQQEQPFLTDDVFLWDRDADHTILVSRSHTGEAVAGNHISFAPQLSSDGRYVAFSSKATDLVPGQIEDSSGQPTTDLFLYDRATGHTVQVGRVESPDGRWVSMSADGRFVAFSRFGADDSEVLLYDRALGAQQLIASEATSPRISADGRYVAFLSAEPLQQVYLYDRISQAITLVTRSSVRSNDESNGFARSPVISADGRYVAFESDADDLVTGQVSAPGRDENDIFLFDRVTGTTALVSRSKTSPAMAVGFSENPLISANGRQVAFTSSVDIAEGDFNILPDAFLFDLDPPPPVTLPSCKLLDTRRRTDRPALSSDLLRVIPVHGRCGVPVTAKQILVKVTVFQPSGKGNLRFYPGVVAPTPSSILRFERNQSRTESFTLPLANGAGTLAILPFVAGKGTVHVMVEVNGYSE
jgi:Tol biopolymer transport system component